MGHELLLHLSGHVWSAGGVPKVGFVDSYISSGHFDPSSVGRRVGGVLYSPARLL